MLAVARCCCSNGETVRCLRGEGGGERQHSQSCNCDSLEEKRKVGFVKPIFHQAFFGGVGAGYTLYFALATSNISLLDKNILLYADSRISRGYCMYIAFWYSGKYRTDLTEPCGIFWKRAVSEITNWGCLTSP